MITTIRNYDTLGAIHTELNEAVLNEQVDFLTLLGKAVDTEDYCGYEIIPSSVGITWMRDNIDAFANRAADALGFYREHLDNHYITGILHNNDLFCLIPEAERVQFVRDVINRHTTSGHWVRTVVEAGVPRVELAQIILDKLRATEVNPSDSRIDFLSYEFLEYGAGSVGRSFGGLLFRDEHTLWSMLSDEQFVEALHICISKAPYLLFGAPDINSRITLIQKLDTRLSHTQVDALLLEAATKLQNLAHVSVDSLERLPFDVRLSIARRTGGPLDLVVRLALELGEENGGIALHTEFAKSFTEVTDTIYRQLYPLLQSSKDRTLASVINLELVRVLTRSGFVIGEVTTGTRYDRRTGRTQKQLQVGWGHKIYVQNHSQHRYFPKEGDQVIINTKYGRVLTPRVVAVDFVPLQS